MTACGLIQSFKSRNRAILCFCLCAGVLSASPKPDSEVLGHIRGKLIDEVSQRPVLAAEIMIEGTEQGCATDSTGAYEIFNIRPGIYHVRYMMTGYKTRIINHVIVNPGRTTWHKVEIVPTAIISDDVSKSRLTGDCVESVDRVNFMEPTSCTDSRDYMKQKRPMVASVAVQGEDIVFINAPEPF